MYAPDKIKTAHEMEKKDAFNMTQAALAEEKKNNQVRGQLFPRLFFVFH